MMVNDSRKSLVLDRQGTPTLVYDNSPKPVMYAQPDGATHHSADQSLGTTSANLGDIHLGEESSSDAYEYDANSGDDSHGRGDQVKLSGPIAFAGDSDAERIPILKEGRGEFHAWTKDKSVVNFPFPPSSSNCCLRSSVRMSSSFFGGVGRVLKALL
jgi:hypothetical protein